jgi:hypothetical protein
LEKFGRSAAPIAESFGETWNAISIGAMDFANTLLGPVAESIRSLQNIWNNGWEDNITNSPFNIEGKTPKKTGYQGMGSLQRVQAPGGYVEVTDRNTGAVIGGQHFDNLSDTNSINAWRKGLVKTPKTGGSTKSVPTMQDFNLQMTKNDMKLQDQKAAGDLVKDMPSPYQMMFDEIKKRYLDKQDFDLGKDVSKNWKVDKNGNLTDRPIKSKTDESIAKDINKFTGYAGKMLGGVDGIFSGISQLGIEIPKGLQDMLGGIQAITSIASGIASVLMVIETLQEAQTVSAAIPFFKHGGIVPHAAGGFMVPGNDHADRTPVLVSSGELILNHAQQNALANELQGNGMQNLHLRTEVSGRNLIVVIENDLKARGKGQLATFKG